MTYWLVGLTALVLVQFAVFFGPPYVPTLRRQRRAALDMLNLKTGQTFYDLGCGDGSLLIDASRRGLRAVGYEINPLLASVAWLRTRRYKKNVRVVIGNFWKADLSDADGIFIFLASRYMSRMDRLISKEAKKPVRLVSYGFPVSGRKATSEKEALFLYKYD